MAMGSELKLRIKSCLVIFLVVLLGNAINIFITNPNPMITRSGLGVDRTTVNGQYNGTEVNDGPITHSLGSASVHQILEGKLPLWNHYEGVGAPLAGDMQPASLFVPFNLLLVLPAGFLIFKIVLETAAGIGMYFLLRMFKLSNVSSVIGGMLFSLNSLFAIFGSAVINPMPFFPWQLYAVEKIRSEILDKTPKGKKFGWIILAFSLAFSIYAGFPETAYINGLLVLAWFIYRLCGLYKDKKLLLRYITHVMIGGLVGLLLAAPIIYLFAHYLMHGANIGGHTGAFAGVGLKMEATPMLLFPYVYGLIFEHSAVAPYWGSLGGFTGIFIITAAFIGAKNQAIPRGVRIFFLVASGVTLARILAVPGITKVIDMLPLMSSAAPHRYVPPIFVISMIIMAAFGLDYAWKKGSNLSLKKLWLPLLLVAALAVTALVFAKSVIDNLPNAQIPYIDLTIAAVTTAAGLAAIAVSSIWEKTRKLVPIVMTAAIIAEMLVLFWIPQLGAPIRSQARMDFGVVDFLQKNLGNNRFYFIGNKNGLKTNYGSYFKLASINTENLPTPKLWEDYVVKKLDNNTSTISFSGAFRLKWEKNSVQDEFLRNIKNYQAIGVKYIVSEINGVYRLSDINAHDYGLRLVYKDPSDRVAVYQMPDFASYASADKCRLTVKSRNEIAAACSEASELRRLELFFDGWSVKVNNETQTIEKYNNLFQSVKIPKGESTITFNFWPQYTTASLAAAGLTLIVIAGYLAVAAVQRISRNRADAFQRIMKFLVSGSLAAITEYMSFAVMEKAGIILIASQTISFLCGFVVSFLLNRAWVFKSKEKVSQQLMKYGLLAAINLVLTNLVMNCMVYVLHVNSLIAKISVMVMVAAWNYVIFSKLIFQQAKTKKGKRKTTDAAAKGTSTARKSRKTSRKPRR